MALRRISRLRHRKLAEHVTITPRFGCIEIQGDTTQSNYQARKRQHYGECHVSNRPALIYLHMHPITIHKNC